MNWSIGLGSKINVEGKKEEAEEGFCDWKIWLDELEQWTGSYMQVQQKRLEGLALGFCDYRKWSDELELWIGLYM